MNEERQKPIPLDYRGQTPDESPESDAGGVSRPLRSRGTLSMSEVTAMVLETMDRPDMTFATRALERQKIGYCVVEKETSSGAYKKPLVLMVKSEDGRAARELIATTMTNRLRVKNLNRNQLDALKMASDDEIWPDRSGNGGIF